MAGEYTFQQSRWGILIPSLVFCLISASQLFAFFILGDLELLYQIPIVIVGPFLMLIFGAAGFSGLLSLVRGGACLRVDSEGFQDDTLLRRRGWLVRWEMIESLDFQPEHILIKLRDPKGSLQGLPAWQRWWMGKILAESNEFQVDAHFLKGEFGDLVWALRQHWRAHQKSQNEGLDEQEH